MSVIHQKPRHHHSDSPPETRQQIVVMLISIMALTVLLACQVLANR
jgi:hypothetical protein